MPPFCFLSLLFSGVPVLFYLGHVHHVHVDNDHDLISEIPIDEQQSIESMNQTYMMTRSHDASTTITQTCLPSSGTVTG